MRAIARRCYQIAAQGSTKSAIILISRLCVRPHGSCPREYANLIQVRGGFMPIGVGQPAPEFTLKDQNQKEIKLSELVGKRNIVLMFYPLDFSPICTNEHACFVNDMKQFEKLDAQLLGLSVDSVWTHKAFAEKMGIG